MPVEDALGNAGLGRDRAEFARRDGFTVEVAKLEDWTLAGRTFDAIIAGTTWH